MRAASKLNVSQPAISGQVRQLEETLGFELFTRTPQGVEVTELGRRYLVEAEKVQSASLDLEDTVSRLRRGRHSTRNRQQYFARVGARR